eukprot:Sspe_Gene.88342::Locus_60376_Transcript_1_1_Confidence_1.000_Length_970::g.88342::m.88342
MAALRGGEGPGRKGPPSVSTSSPLLAPPQHDDVWHHNQPSSADGVVHPLNPPGFVWVCQMLTAVLAGLSLFVVLVVALQTGGGLDECAVTVETQTAKVKELQLSPKLLLGTSEVVIIASIAVHSAGSQRGGGVSFDPYHSFLGLCLLVFYWGGFGFTTFFKYLLGDAICSPQGRPNSVSGHSHFYTFYFLTLPHLALDAFHRREHKPMSPVYLARHLAFWGPCYALFVALVAVQARRTYALGFHTPRQIVYGVAWGLVDAALWVRLFHALYHDPGGSKLVRNRWLLTLCAMWCLSGCTLACVANGVGDV